MSTTMMFYVVKTKVKMKKWKATRTMKSNFQTTIRDKLSIRSENLMEAWSRKSGCPLSQQRILKWASVNDPKSSELTYQRKSL